MNIQFTRHILIESSLRIDDMEIKKDQEKIKQYFKSMFCSMWSGGKYEWNKARMTHTEREWIFKIQAWIHKIIAKKTWEEDFLLITYAKKRECDMIENQILYRIRNAKWKKK